jgi:hypothetical protein
MCRRLPGSPSNFVTAINASLADRGSHIGFATRCRRIASWTNFPQCSTSVGCGLMMIRK